MRSNRRIEPEKAEDLLQQFGERQLGRAIILHGPSPLRSAVARRLAQQNVFRIDLARVSSKYIGETEKNLQAIFQRADNARSILFFDEADALFSRRTQETDAHDRFRSELRHRLATFHGLLILGVDHSGSVPADLQRQCRLVSANDHWPPR